MRTHTHRIGKGLSLGLVFLILSGTFVAAAAGNNAAILAGSSSVPGSGGAGATVAVMVRAQNTGATTWTAGAAYRLGASASNQVAWGGYACGGYMNNLTDGRVFLCQDVPPGGTHDFRFNITLPGSGTARLSVQMVQDAVEWFGQTQSWDISVSSGANLPDVVVDSVRPDPANPQAGQSVQFVSVVRNQGSGPTPSGVVIGVGYFIDGNYVSYGFSSNALAPGASVTITTQGGPWTATAGSHVLMALADDVNRFAESNENNNSRSANFTVGGGCANNPLSTPSDRWKLEIFNNKDLTGGTVEQRYDAAGAGGFTFNWGSGGPSSCAGVDNFGLRFTRTFSVGTGGNYTFTATADDGVRLWVDGQLIIDRWIDQAPTTYTATKSLTAGSHDIRMDYYENGGGATAGLSWQYSGGGCANNPLSTPSDRWKLEIFNNKGLTGSTVEQRYDAVGAGGFTFNWGSGGPSSCAGVDNFGVRFSRTFSVSTSGNYTFTATADDGVRLWVDGQLIIDRWIDQAPTTYTATKSLTAGSHDIRMDYYENGGGAYAALGWQYSGGGCTNNPLSTPSDRWKLEIFNNKDLTGSTVEQRYDAAGPGGFTFNWGSGGPSSCAGVDNFGVRFSRTFTVSTTGNYTFTATADDGVRLWVDGQLIIDRWIDQAPTTYTATKSLTAGSHDIRMDYYENGGGATAALSWQYSGGGCTNNPLSTPSDRWKLEIFNNKGLTGSTVEQRYDAMGAGGFTFNWGSGGPSSCAGVDNFGVRFSRTFSVGTGGNYTFTATADDGVRLWVDGQLMIDRWIDQAPTTYTATKSLTAGSHDIRMDYYENGGGAYAALGWQLQSSGGGELYGMNIDPANPAGNPSSQQLKDAHVRWVRIEWKLNPGYSFYDSRIADYRNAGLKVLLLVDYSSVPGKPASNAPDAAWTAYLQTFNTSLQGIAAHYGNGVDAWQIWNEPDLMAPGSGYDPGVPAGHYGVMLRDSVTTIRAYSSRPIVTGGLASGNADYLAQARNAVGSLTVDAVAVHPYGQRAPDNWPNPSWGFGNMSDLFNRYLAFGKPLWVTESGINDGDTSLYAQYLENVYKLARDQYANRVIRVFWFCWSDGMVPPFGILDANGNPKDTYYRYQSIAPAW